MNRIATFVAIAVSVSLGACQPEKTPEQIAAEQQAAAIKEVAGALGGMMGQNGEVDPAKLAAAIGQAGAIASAMDKDMSPEDRAKLQAITGAISSGQVHPAAAAYFAGANKAFATLGDVKDVAGVEAVRPQLAAIYAEMAAPAAALKAMTDDERDIAMGSATAQLMGMSANAMKLMSKFSYDPTTMEAVSDALEQMPQID
jgi:hypothetical protein